ncbi:MAG TPA: NrsF family protein, partial [Vicinamibacterales bacterium]|nr:NrsF family protein [Vicinamibacterales bacterium]
MTTNIPDNLRARLAADFHPVRALRSPWARTLSILPLAVVALIAAPVVFDVRPGVNLGWLGVWGLSIGQSVMGLVVVGAALRESIPGRDWSRRAIALWLAIPILTVVAVTLTSWQASPVFLRADWWMVGGICFAGSAAMALPVVAFASILAARAYPTRPAIAGALLGLGAGLMADAGWRIFCHFSEPAHVLSAHL